MMKLMASEKKFGKYLQEMELVKIKCLTQRSSGTLFQCGFISQLTDLRPVSSTFKKNRTVSPSGLGRLLPMTAMEILKSEGPV